MKRRVKMFSKGDYGKKGTFDLESLKNIVKNTADTIKAQYSHTSHWEKLNKDKGEKLIPLAVGEFSNFGVENDSIYGDVEFNDIGEAFLNGGIIDKLSVETNDNRDAFTAVAALPLGVKPAVLGAEFEYDMEFENEGGTGDMTLKEMLVKATVEEKKEILAELQAELETEAKTEDKTEDKTETKDETKAKDETKVKTEAEIRAEIKAEIAKEFELKATEKELKGKLDKVAPALREIFEFAIEKACEAEEATNTYEFEVEGKKVEKTKAQEFNYVLDNLKGIKNMDITNEFQSNNASNAKTNQEIIDEKMKPYRKK